MQRKRPVPPRPRPLPPRAASHPRRQLHREVSAPKRRLPATLLVLLVLLFLGVLWLWAYRAGLLQDAHQHLPVDGQPSHLFVQRPDETSDDFGTHTHPSGERHDPSEAHRQETISLLAVGDVLMHQSLINAAKGPEGVYDFAPLFRAVAPIFASADYAVFDMEGTLKGKPYAGYPSFSVPETLAGTMKSLGFDAAVTANNHAMDYDVPGMLRTVEVLREAGLSVLGTRLDEEEPGFLIQEIQGIRLGLAAFTYESPRVQRPDGLRRSLNNVRIPLHAEALIDSVSVAMDAPALMAEDQARVTARVAAMKEAGAEATVVFMHWGTEYADQPNPAQEVYAQTLADAGVDLVLACGPHVVQPIQSLRSSDGTHQMLCFYSMGNFVSNQQYETGNSEGRAEDGLVALAEFQRQADGQVRLFKAAALACTVYKRYPKGKEAVHSEALVLPVAKALRLGAAYPYAAEEEAYVAQLTAAKKRFQVIQEASQTTHLPLFWLEDVQVDWDAFP